VIERVVIVFVLDLFSASSRGAAVSVEFGVEDRLRQRRGQTRTRTSRGLSIIAGNSLKHASTNPFRPRTCTGLRGQAAGVRQRP